MTLKQGDLRNVAGPGIEGEILLVGRWNWSTQSLGKSHVPWEDRLLP